MRTPHSALLPTLVLAVSTALRADTTEIPAPPDSVRFGEEFAVLPNGNIVVVDRDWSGTATNAGAAYLYRPDGTLVSRVTGSSANDSIGNWGITVLPGGNYLLESRDWDHGAAIDAGAVTFGDADTGVSGVVSPANSLVGSSTGDRVGTVSVLANGNYTVTSQDWAHGAVDGVGAVTWGSGETGVVGPVGTTNSLVGTSANDHVGGGGGVVPLPNGHGIVASASWSDGGTPDVGAVTWIRGDRPTVGTVSAANSLIGSATGDFFGVRIHALANGHYVVANHWWDHAGLPNVGAVTWARGDAATSAVVSTSNSLVGAQAEDHVASDGVEVLPGGAYVVASSLWDLGGIANVGAVTRVDGSAAFAGVVTSANSLHGSTAEDSIGDNRFVVLANGNYVLLSPQWDNGAAANAGAATWCPGATGCTGPLGPANSLVGESATSRVGTFLVALTNGNYLVVSQAWDRGAIADAGAVTFGPGTTGIAGVVTTQNSLVGSTAYDRIGTRVVALANGHYAVGSADWDRGAIVNAGAVTWGHGTTGTVGAVSTANSIVGSHAGDEVGSQLDPLDDGRFVAGSSSWDRGALEDAGAFTWLAGTGPTTGDVTAANSLVGARAFDELGYGVDALPGGASAVYIPHLDTDDGADTGAVVLAPPGGLVGEVPQRRAVFGTVPDEGAALYYEWSAIDDHLVVAHAPGNRVVLLREPADALFADGYE